jgi:hypothetical protein
MTMGLAVWGVLLGLVFAYEGIGLVSATDRWPSFSHVLRSITATTAGRWILFGMWLWVGWHLFARGWRTFFGG